MAITRGVGPLYLPSLTNVISSTGTLNGTTAGRSLVFVVLWYDPSSTTTISSITISGESNATLIPGSKYTNDGGTGSTSGQIAFLANNTTGGNKSITITFSAITYADVAVMEYIGMDLASQPDASISGTGATTATLNLTTVTANALIVAGSVNNSGEFTAGSGYTLLGGGGMPNTLTYTEAEDDVDAGAAGSKTVDFTGFASVWAMTAASFKIAGGPATTPRTFTGTDSLAGGELL